MKTPTTTVLSVLITLCLAAAALGCVGGGAPETETARRNLELPPELLAEYCALEPAAPNGWCIELCASTDPDCLEGADRVEFEPVHIREPDPCFDRSRYADGICDDVCQHPDPDCTDEPGPDALADWEIGVCGRFHPDAAPVPELAGSLCIEREGPELPACIAHCVRVQEEAAR